MRIFLYVAIISIGAWLGAGGKLSEGFTRKLSKLQFASLLLLLFIMGVNIGINDDVINEFYKLGFQAIILSAFAIAFSVFFVKLISGFAQRGRKDSE